MRAEARLLLIIAVFFFGLTAIYALWSREPAGAIMLAASGLLGLIPGLYYYWWSKHMDMRPEDNPNAGVNDASGAIGAFPNGSIWPFVFGLGAAAVGIALVFGYWTALLGGALGISAMIGVAVESRRGGLI